MADFKPKYAASPDALTVTNLASLADNAFWESPARGNDVDVATALDMFITILSTTLAVDTEGFMNVFLAASVDGGTDFAGTSPDGTESTETFDASMQRNMALIGVMPMDVVETTARTFRQNLRVDLPPKDYVIVMENQTGAALGATVSVEIMEIQATDA